MRLFFDLNVVLDVLARRDPWLDHSGATLSLVEEGIAEGYVAAHSITTLYYLVSKQNGLERATAAIVDLLGLVRAVNVDHETLLKALSLRRGDLEDAVQAVCALDICADFVVTRNTKDFQSLSIPVVTPSELLAILAG